MNRREVNPVPEGFHTVTPYLIVDDGASALSFIEQAFDGEVVSRFDDDGKLVHAEIRIGDSMVMLGESNEKWPETRAMVHLYVKDVDDVYRKALEAGARSVREPEDMFYGDRSGGVTDPSGIQWWISTHVEDVPPEELADRHEASRNEARS